jgi:hypothetical protein
MRNPLIVADHGRTTVVRLAVPTMNDLLSTVPRGVLMIMKRENPVRGGMLRVAAHRPVGNAGSKNPIVRASDVATVAGQTKWTTSVRAAGT